jgi:hypothetical protein
MGQSIEFSGMFFRGGHMKKYLAAVAALSIALSASGQAFSQSESGLVEDLSKPTEIEPPMLGIHWARGFEPNFRARGAAHNNRPSRSPNMTYHGGKIMPTAVTENIFWGPGWANSSFVGDKITGLDTWYYGFTGSHYAATSDEYTGSNGRVGPYTTHKNYAVDTTASIGGSTSAILAEVCKMITSPDPSGNGYYSVYIDQPRNGNYCAYHSAGTCNGTPVQFAFFWSLDGDPGCDPQDTSGLHSQGLAALANVSGHELSEARTDPASPGAWYDSFGYENGDKCAWTFGAPLVTFSNGSQWKIQGEWSNAAYSAGTGYPNSSGQKGCLSGQ